MRIDDDFPATWEIAACRSTDGTPLLLLDTYPDADHDGGEVPYLRLYVNDGVVYDHPRPPREGACP